MVLSDLLLFSGPLLGLAGMALAKLPDLVDGVTGNRGQADFERFMMDTRRRGLDYAGAMKELDVRTAFARLRREASDAVAVDIQNWQPILDATVQKCLADNPQHDRELKAMMQGLSYGHILYDREAAMVDDTFRGFRRRRSRFTEDQRAAVRVLQ